MSIDTLAAAIARKQVTERTIELETAKLAQQMGVAIEVVVRLRTAAEAEHRGRPYNGPVDFSCRRNWFFDTH